MEPEWAPDGPCGWTLDRPPMAPGRIVDGPWMDSERPQMDAGRTLDTTQNTTFSFIPAPSQSLLRQKGIYLRLEKKRKFQTMHFA